MLARNLDAAVEAARSMSLGSPAVYARSLASDQPFPSQPETTRDIPLFDAFWMVLPSVPLFQGADGLTKQAEGACASP